ncbi:glyoxylate/hydroxypyruvate reductase A [Komagataeibacter sp. FXV2]|nr:glyoxylate/hydroxypyruvate reductase A [Komagataeibacter sp. FXV2]
MTCLIIKSGSADVMGEWKALFGKYAPGLRVAGWNDPDIRPEEVDFALVWEPDPGRLAQMTNLRAIISSGAGVDHITADPSWPRHVPLVRMGTDDATVQMGDYVTWAAFSLLRPTRQWFLHQQRHEWHNDGQSARTSTETCVGVMGLGNLGTHVAQRLVRAGFAMRGWSRSPKDVAGVECFHGDGQRREFLGQTDILVSLLPATGETRGLINRELLSCLRAPAALISVGRGTQVVEEDVLDCLDRGILSGAVMDVFATEPLPASSPLWAHPRVIVTPHVAAEASRAARARYTADVIASVMKGDAPKLLYLPERGY